MHKLGYYFLDEGRELILNISNTINKNRYTTNPRLVPLPTKTEILKVTSLIAPFDITTGLDHTKLAQSYSRSLGSRKGFSVHIFENGVEILNSPFSSYNKGHQAIGLSGSSKAIGRNINTGKAFLGKYTFYSALK